MCCSHARGMFSAAQVSLFLMTEKPASGSGTSFGEGWSIEEAVKPAATSQEGEQQQVIASGQGQQGVDAAGVSAEAVGSDAASAEPAADGTSAASASKPAQLSNTALVALGLLGGVYLIYSWVWLSWTKFYADQYKQVAQGSGTVGAVLDQIIFWTAPAAPLLWFVTVLILARKKKVRVRFVWLLVGLVVTLPYQFFAGVGA